MNTSIKKIGLSLAIVAIAGVAKAQQPDTVAEFKPSGKLWGLGFGDFAYKGGTDEANRGGTNQYTNIPVNTNMFQWRRLYLGYDYNISKKFSSELVIAAEDDWAAGIMGQAGNSFDTIGASANKGTVKMGGNGDVLMNTKFAPYIKIANIRWKNIYKGADLIFGQTFAPGFAKNGSGMASEEVWGYRPIERTIADLRRTPAFDMGVSLMGKCGAKENYGYVLMMGNGQGAKPENDNFKMFFVDVWAKFFDKKMIIDLYQDYQRGPKSAVTVAGPYGVLNQDRNMTKIFFAYVVPKFTIGVEYFMNTLMNDVKITRKDTVIGVANPTYYKTTFATGLSVFVKGRIYKDQLGFYARFDNYDPTGNLKSIADNQNTKSYSATTGSYEPSNKEMFATFGIDYSPIKNVHLMPNIWVNTYKSTLDVNAKNSGGTTYQGMNKTALSGINGTDLVYRLTFYYVYGR